jgi:ABC-type Fe3+-hydroxamate transport system substrate-binding protein
LANDIERGFYSRGRQNELVEQIKVIDPTARIIWGSVKRLEEQLDELKNNQALLSLVDNSAVQENKIELTKEQKLMIEMSEADIQNGRTIDYKNN